MKKGIVIALCVLLVLALLAGGGYYLLCTKAGEAVNTQRALYEQYQALLQNAQKARLTVMENGETVGEYTLEELGLLDELTGRITASFTQSERTSPDEFEQLGLGDKLEWRTLAHTQAGTFAPDLAGYTDAALVADLGARTRAASQDAYMDYDGERFFVVEAVAGDELAMDELRRAAAEAVSAFIIGTDSAPQAEIEASEYYLPPQITTENTAFDFNALLEEKMQGVTLTIDLNLEGAADAQKVVTLRPKELMPYVSLGADGALEIDGDGLTALAQGWAELAGEENVSFILNTYVDGPKPMDFLKVDYVLNAGELAQMIGQAIRQMTAAELKAPLECWKNGEPYAPLTETYVEVDIDNQRLTVYRAGEVVTSTDVVTGNLNGFQTITGLYYAYNKDEDQWMQGEDYLVFSDYWIGISGAYGMHDASWRTHFGKDFYVNGGSHGCVNIPVEAMPKIYETVEVGDAVILFGANKWFEPDPETTRILQS